MGLATLALIFTSACHAGGGVSTAATADSASIRRDIAWLADDAREGRATGSAGFDSAARYVAARFEALGLKPVVPVDSTCRSACALGYQMPYPARPLASRHDAAPPPALRAQNVVAVLRGSDAALANEYVIVGAHLDHLGRSSDFALDPEAKDAIRNGADDNASGVAAVLELARLFARHPARRSIVFTAFSGEELGLLGSAWWADHSPVPLASTRAMVNFDMVGRMHDDRLIVYGVATATELPGIVDSANVAPRLVVSAVGDGFGPSDHSSFYAKNLPVLHLFSDLHPDYHRATDDADKINAAGEARIVAFAERTIRAIADRGAPLTFVRAPAPAPRAGSSREGSSTYLGSIPDMAAGTVPGLRLSGVRAGSPADKGGLKSGDVIVELAGTTVKDLYTYTDALYAHKPGETIAIVVLRDGARVTVRVTLGERGR
ncbi:MAG: M28 family peptidase [Gemmatimonadetes bacterium]|nr:M28 family peptidase [Gemmatimonadota bacterium]